MKKYCFCFALLLCFGFVVSGCSSINFLKTSKINVGVANFYEQAYVSNLKKFQGVGTNQNLVAEQNDRTEFANHITTFNQIIAEERCFVSAIDFLWANDQSLKEGSEYLSSQNGIYEYSVVLNEELIQFEDVTFAGTDCNAHVVVSQGKKNSELTCYLFYKQKSDNVQPAELFAELESANLTCGIKVLKYDLQTKTYTLSYNKNGGKFDKSLTATFDQEKGCFKYEAATTAMLDTTSVAVTIKKEIYHYGSAIGFRQLSNYKKDKEVVNVVYEQLCKDFYSCAKLGKVKNVAGMLAMDTIQEDKLAKSNSSDKTGFVMEYNNQELQPVLTCVKYGSDN